MRILVDALGVLGIITTIIVYQQRDRQRMLLWKLATDVTWVTHYLALGAMSAVATTGVAILRSIVFLNYKHKWAQSRAWLYVFMAASIGFSALAWEGPLSLLTLVASMACIVAYWIGKPKVTRVVSIPASMMYLAYTIISGSVEGSICEAFIIVSSVVGFLRLDRAKKRPKAARAVKSA